MTDDLLSQTLRDARRRRNWTQRSVADQLQALAHYKHRDNSAAVNADMVSKWERGEKGVSPYYRDLLVLLFDSDAASLGLTVSVPTPRAIAPEIATTPIEDDLASAVAETTNVLHQLGPAAALLEPRMAGVWKDELMRRRTLVKVLGLAPMAPAIARIPGQGPSAPRATARDLDDLADRYQTLYHSASPSALIGPVIAHLDAASDALRASRSGTERVKLLMNRARVSLLAGRLSFFDFDDAMSARGYYNLAVEAASEAGDRHQSAAALGHMAFIPAAEFGMSAALDYLDGAKRQIDRDPHGPLASWVFAIESEFHSHVGNHGAALRAVDSAEEAFSSSNLHADLRWFDYYDQNRLAGFAGYANLQAGRFDEAAERLNEALDLPLSAVKQRSVFLTDLATVHVHAGDIDLACQVASDATDELRRAGYATGLGRLREFRDLVSAHRSAPAVRDFSERLSTLELEEA